MYLNIKIKEDFRTLKKDTEYKFDFTNQDRYLIVGPNGCGKSTLINIIRSFQCDNANDSHHDKLGYAGISGMKDKAEIDTDFEKFYFISSEFDDPLSLDNMATAEATVTNGGFYWKRKSNGERQLQNLGKWVQENQDNWNEKCLLILDEADKGFDLRYQVGLHNMLINIPAKNNVKFLVVSHTLIPILLEDKVYAFQYRRMLSPSTYIFVETGYDIKIDKDERTEV